MPGSRLRIVVARYGPSAVGGAETLSRAVAMRLAARGWQVSVVTTCALEETTWANALPAGVSRDDGVEVTRYPVVMPRRPGLFRQLSRGFFRLPPHLRPESLWLTAQGPWSPRLERSLSAEPWTPTLFVGYLYRPTHRGVVAVRGPRLLMPLAHDELPLRLRTVGRALQRCDALWYATPEERTLLEAVQPRAAGIANAVGNAGVEAPEQLDGGRFRSAYGVQGDYLLFGGRSTAGKGTEEMLAGMRALRQTHPDAQLVVTGEAGENLPAEPGLLPLGRLEAEARWDAIAGARAVLVPSFHESLSLLALEAWAAGRPALLNGASPVLCGQAERSGGALTYRGPSELADAARRLLDDPGFAAHLGEAGRAHVATSYRWEDVLDRLEGLVATATERASGRARR